LLMSPSPPSGFSMSTFQLSSFGMIRIVPLATFALLVFALTGASVAAEADAKFKGIGVWRGPFTAPADYREMLAGHPQER